MQSEEEEDTSFLEKYLGNAFHWDNWMVSFKG